MAMFRYEAVEPTQGKMQRGAMEATSAQEVAQKLTARGYHSVHILANEVRPVTTTAARPVAFPSEPLPPGGVTLTPAIKPAEMGMFYRQMVSLLHAGFTPATVLADLGGRTANKRVGAAVRQMAGEVANGTSFADSVAKHPDVFPAHVVGLMRAGEMGGFLEYACEEAALGAENDAALRQGIWLPKILFWQSIWSVLLLQPLANNLGNAFTKGLAAAGAKSAHDFLFVWLPIGIACHLAAEVGGLWWRQPFFAPTRDRLSLIIPVMGKLAKMRAVAAFTRMLRRLLLSGISPEPAFVGAAQSVPNTVLRDRLMAGVPVLRAGNGLDAAMNATGMFEHDPLQLLITGQKTGQWTEMLDQVTAYYQDRAAKATEDAKAAQKRLGILVTIISSGYVLIVSTVAPMKAAFQVFDDFTK